MPNDKARFDFLPKLTVYTAQNKDAYIVQNRKILSSVASFFHSVSVLVTYPSVFSVRQQGSRSMGALGMGADF